jgi:cytochrome oxidase Cu insertion factor (SCO1/SenC/PrrC family)
MSAAPRTRRSGWLLVAVVALFLSSFLAAVVLVQSGWRPSATRNYGELVTPPRPLADVALTGRDGEPVDLDDLRGKWSWVYFGPGACPPPCRDNLYKMRQVTAAQGTEAHRVQQLYIVTDGRPVDAALLADYPATRVLHGRPAAIRALAGQFELDQGGPLDGLHRLYLVDPLGNLMMSYPADADPSRINKDLKLLLRASQIG